MLYSMSFSLSDYSFSARTFVFLETMKVYCLGVICFLIQWGIILMIFDYLKYIQHF